jgi:hypothetical protein
MEVNTIVPSEGHQRRSAGSHLRAPPIILLLVVFCLGIAESIHASPAEETRGHLANHGEASGRDATGDGSQQAGTFYVSPAGSDANDGSMAAPWKSINYAIQKTAPGDVILLVGDGGEFDEWVEIDLGEGGVEGAEKVIRSAPGPMAILNGIVQIRAPYLRLEGIQIRWKNPGKRSAVGVSADHVSVVGCDITGPGYWGAIEVHANDVLLEDNNVHDFGNGPDSGQANLDHGIYLAAGFRLIVRNNRVHHNTAYGIHVYDHWKDAMGGIVIEGNWVYENGNKAWHSGVLVSGKGGLVEDVHLRNNILWGHKESGINIHGPNIQAEIYNNTIFAEQYGVKTSQLGTLKIKNNLFYQTTMALDVREVDPGGIEADHNGIYPDQQVRWMGSSISHDEWVSLGFGLHDLLLNPQLKDPVNHIFELEPTSPAVDVGLDVGLPFLGKAPDLGAVESPGGPDLIADLNLDGIVDAVDVDLCVLVLLALEEDGGVRQRADVNRDGALNALDLQLVINSAAGGGGG